MKYREALIVTIAVISALASGRGRLSAYSFMPLVTCYSLQENSCATQAWDATQDKSGILYFGTTDGLLTFDGVKWDHYSVPGISIIRSVKAINDKIYIGAYEEFGYFERDEYGVPEYHSLNSLLKDYKYRDDEFWSITEQDGKIYFQSFRSVFCYDGKEVGTLQIDGKGPLNLSAVNGKLYTQVIYAGFSKYTGTDYEEVISRGTIGNTDVVKALPFTDKSILLCTEKDGLYQISANRHVRKFTTEADAELKSHCINRAIRMKDGTIVLGTLRNGVYGISPSGEVMWHYNIENGLGNNTVLNLMEDKSGNVWVMMDHGISLIHSSLSYSFLKPDAGEPYIGMTYAMNRTGDKLYLGTNQGLYWYSFSKKTIHSCEDLRSQIWYINNIDGQNLIGGGTVSAEIDGENITNFTTNGSTDLKKGRIHNQEVLVESSYYALRIHKRQKDGKWGLSHEVKGFGAPIRQLEIDNDGSLWCAHSAQGVMHVELTSDLNKVESIELFKDAGPGHTRSTSFVMKIRGQIIISDGDSLYRYDSASKSLKLFSALYKDLQTTPEIYSSTPVNDRQFWLSSRKSYSLIEYRDGHYYRMLTVPLDHLTLQSNGVNNKVYVDDSKNCYLALNNGIGFINLGQERQRKLQPAMTIASVEHINEKGVPERLKLKTDIDNLTESRGNISFRLSYPSYNFRAPRFMYKLEGPEIYTNTTENPEISYVGLKHGDYTFYASMIDEAGDAIAYVNYNFTVTRPTYLSYWAMSGYTLAIVALGIALSKLYTRRQIKRQRHVHEIERVAQNVKILEQERIISEQQKQLLQNELDLKSKELASMALEAGYKGQVIENLRETITGQRRKGQLDSQEIDNLIKTINSYIDNTEFWNIFHNNFDLIHENFFRNLRQRFPELTPTDLKFCALMRLNMSTKDIASFTNLTIRGVETERYRIRRKLGLDSKESIVQFLIDFKKDQNSALVTTATDNTPPSPEISHKS